MNRAYASTILTAALACAGCITTSTSLPGASEAPVRAPEVLRTAAACHVTGPARVVSSKAFVPAGVEGNLERDRYAAPEGGGPLQGPSDPEVDRHPAPLGFVVEARPRPDRQLGLGDPRPADHAARTDLVPLGADRMLLAFVDGDFESHSARVRVVSATGEPLGPAFEVSPPDVSAIGRPSVALGDDGHGTVAYLASNGHGFSVLATPIECER